MNPARLCIRGYVLTIGLFSYWANYSVIMEMGTELTEAVQKDYLFCKGSLGQTSALSLILSFARKGALLISDPDGIGPYP